MCLSFTWLSKLGVTFGKFHCKRSSVKQAAKAKARDLVTFT